MKRSWAYLAGLLPFTEGVPGFASNSMGGVVAGTDGPGGQGGLSARGGLQGADADGEHAPGQSGDTGDDSPDGLVGGFPADRLSTTAQSVSVPASAPRDGGTGQSASAPTAAANGIEADNSIDAPHATTPGAGIPQPVAGGGFSSGGVPDNGSGLTFGTTRGGDAGQPRGAEAAVQNADADGPRETDADSMLISLGGTATGIGDGATSGGDVALDIVDYGLVTIGYGRALYEATGGAGAFAETFGAAEGADLFFRYDTSGGNGETAFSSTHVLAIDFEDDGAAAGSPGLGEVDWRDLLAEGPFLQLSTEEFAEFAVGGNTSSVDFSVGVADEAAPTTDISATAVGGVGSTLSTQIASEQAALTLRGDAEGYATLLSADVALLEVEDHFSSVSGLVTGIA